MYTVGFVGSNKSQVAETFTKFVTKVTESGRQRDQEHPPAIVCGIRERTPVSKLNNFLLVKELGAQIILSCDPLKPEEITKIKADLGDGVTILHPTEGETLDDLLGQVMENSYQDTKESHKTNGGFLHLADKDQWSASATGQKFQKLSTHSSHAIGVIGGAGVMTGARFIEDLAVEGEDFLMLSDSTSPDKNNAIVRFGSESFVPRYHEDVRTLSFLTSSIAIPCNTAHIKKGEFCAKFLQEAGNEFAKLNNIGDATLSMFQNTYPDQKQVILLGTPATLTHPESAYNTDKFDAAKITVIKPNEEQMQKIYRAIYKIKGYKSDEIIDTYRETGALAPQDKLEPTDYAKLKTEAKALIIEVINEIRVAYGDADQTNPQIPIILGCTEFPVVFTEAEMAKNGLISSSSALAKACKQRALPLEKESPDTTKKRLVEGGVEGREGGSSWVGKFPPQAPASEAGSFAGRFAGSTPRYASSSSEQSDSEAEIDDTFSLGSVLEKYDLSASLEGAKLKVHFIPKDKDASRTTNHNIRKQFCLLMGISRASHKVNNHTMQDYFSIPLLSTRSSDHQSKVEKLQTWLKDHKIDTVEKANQRGGAAR